MLVRVRGRGQGAAAATLLDQQPGTDAHAREARAVRAISAGRTSTFGSRAPPTYLISPTPPIHLPAHPRPISPFIVPSTTPAELPSAINAASTTREPRFHVDPAVQTVSSPNITKTLRRTAAPGCALIRSRCFSLSRQRRGESLKSQCQHHRYANPSQH